MHRGASCPAICSPGSAAAFCLSGILGAQELLASRIEAGNDAWHLRPAQRGTLPVLDECRSRRVHHQTIAAHGIVGEALCLAHRPMHGRLLADACTLRVESRSANFADASSTTAASLTCTYHLPGNALAIETPMHGRGSDITYQLFRGGASYVKSPDPYYLFPFQECVYFEGS